MHILVETIIEISIFLLFDIIKACLVKFLNLFIISKASLCSTG